MTATRITQCSHERCETKCTLAKYAEYAALGPNFRIAEIDITCLDCGRVARFRGLTGGLGPGMPRVSVTEDELRAPIVFQTDEEWTAGSVSTLRESDGEVLS